MNNLTYKLHPKGVVIDGPSLMSIQYLVEMVNTTSAHILVVKTVANLFNLPSLTLLPPTKVDIRRWYLSYFYTGKGFFIFSKEMKQKIW